MTALHGPTAESCAVVSVLAAHSIPREVIDEVIGISWPTLLGPYHLELDDAKPLSCLTNPDYLSRAGSMHDEA
jgi:hypothetical protein